MTFQEKYIQTTKTNESFVCVGLDTDLDLLPEHLLSKNNPIAEFNRQIIDQTRNQVAAYKLNLAFYLAAGRKGLLALYETITYIPPSIPVIIDCKAGDIANTMSRYGDAFLSELQADAITVNPLMGEDVITPLIKHEGKFFFILALTSNPSATDFLKQNDLYRKIARKIDAWGAERFGAVVGATNSQQLSEMREMMPKTIFLIPGIGAQGGSMEEVMKNAPATKKEPRILINSSRGIIFKDRGRDFAKVASEETEKLRLSVNKYL